MAVSSEDDDKQVSDVQSHSAEDYEGDEGESYPGEEEDEDEDDDLDDLDDDDLDDEELDSDGDEDDLDDLDTVEGVSGMRNGAVDDDDSNGHSNHSSSVPRHRLPPPQHNFAPPFYGRPPTPLPPSPSLTSLLRPSRPTTPDASDDELEPVPRASPQVPTYEYYGFVLYLFSSLAFLMYLLWSYLPSPFLHALGIYYYPNRWWSLAIPSFLVSTIVYIYVALASYNTEILTLPLNSVETIVDEAAKMAAVDEHGRIYIAGGPDGSQIEEPEEQQYRSKCGGGGNNNKNNNNNNNNNSKDNGTWPIHHHQRQPSSPSPPLSGQSGWGTVNTSRHGKNKNRQGKKGGNDGRSTAVEESGLTMGGSRARGQGRPGRRASEVGEQYSKPDWNTLWSEGTDAVMDIPLAGVCEVLYA